MIEQLKNILLSNGYVDIGDQRIEFIRKEKPTIISLNHYYKKENKEAIVYTDNGKFVLFSLIINGNKKLFHNELKSIEEITFLI